MRARADFVRELVRLTSTTFYTLDGTPGQLRIQHLARQFVSEHVGALNKLKVPDVQVEGLDSADDSEAFRAALRAALTGDFEKALEIAE